MSFFAQFREVQAGQRPSASQYNQLLRLVKQITSSLMANGMFSPGTGFITRRGLAGGPGSVIRLAKAQESAQGDEFISVKLLGADGNETGAAFDVQGLIVDSGTALDACFPAIAEDDILPVFRGSNGQWYIAGVFDQYSGSGSGIYLVKTQESAAARDYVSCKLCDAFGNESGDAFDVYGLIANAGYFTTLNTCIPRIVAGDILFAREVDQTWFFVTYFDGSINCDCASS